VDNYLPTLTPKVILNAQPITSGLKAGGCLLWFDKYLLYLFQGQRVTMKQGGDPARLQTRRPLAVTALQIFLLRHNFQKAFFFNELKMQSGMTIS